MKTSEIIGVTLNVSILSIFYTALGGLLSYILFQFFQLHGKEWEEQSILYQIADISLQLTIVGLTAFWVTYNIREAPPIFPVSKEMDELVDTYISGIFFTYSVFLFIEHLSTKIQFVYNRVLGDTFSLRKMDNTKFRDM